MALGPILSSPLSSPLRPALGGGAGWWPPGSVLAFDFEYIRAYNSLDSAKRTPDSILTYTAPSPKLVYGSDGVLRYAPHNLLSASEAFTSWTQTGVTISGQVITATAGGANHRLSRNIVNSNRHRVFFDLKAGTHPFVQILDGSSTDNYATFDLSNGTVGASGSNATASIVALGDGVYRCNVVYGTAAVNGNCFLQFASSAAAVWGSTFSAVGTETITAYRGQISLMPSLADVYVPTTSAAVYSLPIDHNPTTFEPLGVLIEEQRTNLCLYSDDFTNAAWVKSNLTAAKTATGPDAVANSASTLTATAANATARQDVTSVSAARITSAFIKRRTGTGAVYVSQGGTTGSELVVNGTFTMDTTGWTASGATLAVVSSELEVTNTGAAAGIADSDAFATVVGTAYLVGYTARRGTSSSVGIEVRTTSGSAETSITLTNTSNVDGFLYFIASTTSTFIRVSSNQAVLGRTGYFDNLSVKAAVETTVTVTSDWTRVATASATITNPPLIIRMATSGDAIDVALFQHELGAFITSPVPTVASQVTRAADQVSILTSAFAFNHVAGSWVVEFDLTGYNVNYRLLDGGAAYRWFYQPSNVNNLSTYSGAVALVTSIPDPRTAPVSAAMGYDAVGRSITDSGDAVNTDTNPYGTASTVVQLGSFVGGAGNFMNGHIKRLTYFPTRRTNADLQSLTV